MAMSSSVRNPTKCQILDSTAWVPDSTYGVVIRKPEWQELNL